MTDTKPNAELAYKVLDHIDAHPEQWNQRWWISRPHEQDCGTAGCFAGWASLLSGDVPDWSPAALSTITNLDITEWVRPEQSTVVLNVATRAAELLDLHDVAADQLFYAGNDRETLGRLVDAIFGPRPTA